MAKIAIVFNFGSEYRQFVSSGFIDLLSYAGHSVEVISRHEASDFQIDSGLFYGWKTLPEFRLSRLSAFIASTSEKLHARKLQKSGLKGWDYGRLRNPSFKERLAGGIQDFIAFAALHSRLVDNILSSFSRRMLDHYGEKTYRVLLEDGRPDLIIVTVPKLLWQSVFLAQAKKLGIRTVCFYHTNKDAVAAPMLDHPFDRIGVWNAWMREVLLEHNPWLTPQDVRICGCSHFDCLVMGGGLSVGGCRSMAGGAFGGGVTVLYSAADPALFKSEFRYIRLLSELLEEIDPDHSTVLVVRLNPMDDTGILESLVKTRLKNAVVSKPAWYFNRKKNICVQQPEDVAVFSGLLNSAAVCVGLSSTLAIDCAVTGLPFINIGFDLPGEACQGKTARALWDADFYMSVRVSGAAGLAESPAVLKSKLVEYIWDRKALEAQQGLLRSIELGGVPPGKAKNAYLEAISDMLMDNLPSDSIRNASQ